MASGAAFQAASEARERLLALAAKLLQWPRAEIQLSGLVEALHLDWVFGFYGYDEELTNDFQVLIGTQGPEYIGRLVNQGSGGLVPVAVFQNQFNAGEGRNTAFGQDNVGWSLFTHDIFHVTDRLDLTLGARYSWEKKEGSAIHAGTPPGSIPGRGSSCGT